MLILYVQCGQNFYLLLLNVTFSHCLSAQGIIDMNRNGNFCKGTGVGKIVAETKVDARVEQ